LQSVNYSFGFALKLFTPRGGTPAQPSAAAVGLLAWAIGSLRSSLTMVSPWHSDPARSPSFRPPPRSIAVSRSLIRPLLPPKPHSLPVSQCYNPTVHMHCSTTSNRKHEELAPSSELISHGERCLMLEGCARFGHLLPRLLEPLALRLFLGIGHWQMNVARGARKAAEERTRRVPPRYPASVVLREEPQRNANYAYLCATPAYTIRGGRSLTSSAVLRGTVRKIGRGPACTITEET
jgi:hypothetical protein